GHHHSELSRDELAAFLLYVLAFLNGREDRRIGRGPPDAVGFEPLHQGRFVESRRRLGEMLFGLDVAETEMLAFGHNRQLMLQLLVFLVDLVLALFVDLHEAVELGHRAGRAETVVDSVLTGSRNVDRGLVEYSRKHLACDEALPD